MSYYAVPLEKYIQHWFPADHADRHFVSQLLGIIDVMDIMPVTMVTSNRDHI